MGTDSGRIDPSPCIRSIDTNLIICCLNNLQMQPCTRRVSAISSGPRQPGNRAVKRIKSAETATSTATGAGIESRCELDTRADTCCADNNCRPIFFTGQQCDVNGFHDGFEAVADVPIATVATLWNEPFTGRGYILVLHETLYFGKNMDHSLINPNQLRDYGVAVYDNPYDDDPQRSMGIEIDEQERIPFQSKGSTIFFTSRYPTDEEMESFPHIVLTSDVPWEPQNVVMPGGIDDESYNDNDRLIQQVRVNAQRGANRHHLMFETDCVAYSATGNTEQLFIERLINSVKVNDKRQINKLQSKTRHSKFSTEHVASIFNVGLGTAQSILAATTQEGIRHAVTPLTRRYRIDHIHLHHTYLGGNWTLDHVESAIQSIRGNTGAFAFTNGNLVAIYPTPTKSDQDATESLRRFTEEIGIPANLKCDMASAFVGRHTSFQRLCQ